MPKDDYVVGEKVSWKDKHTEDTKYGVIDTAYPPTRTTDGLYHIKHEGWFLGIELRRDTTSVSQFY